MTAQQRPDVSVVVVTYNSSAVIADCLLSVRDSGSVIKAEVIVVDNASRDDTGSVAAAADPGARILHLPRNLGLSAAINAGVAASSGEFVLQLNPDARLAPGALAILVAFLRAHHDVGVAAPKLLNPDGSLQLSCRAFPGYATALFARYSVLTRLWPNNPWSRRYLMTGFDHQTTTDVDWASGAALLYRRELHDQLGGWDADFFLFSEDVDFCKRAHEAGWRVVYVPDAVVEHAIGISKHPSTRAVIERHHSMWHYYRKHARRHPIQDVFTAPAIALRCAFVLASRALRTVSPRR